MDAAGEASVETGPRAQRPAWVELFVALGGPAVGVVLAWLLLTNIVLPTIGYPKAAARVIAMGEMLGAESGEDLVFVIGNSVGVEGIDAGAVEAAAGDGVRVRNISCNGLGLATVRAMMPRVLDTGAGTVCLIVVPRMIHTVNPPHPDRAYAMAAGGFAEGYNADDLAALERWFDSDSYEAVTAPEWRATVHFRLAPLNIFNERIRTGMRSGVLRVAPDNWESPHELNISIEGARLERHLNEIGAGVDRSTESDDRSGLALVREIVAEIRGSGAGVVLVLPGLHPELRERATALRGELETAAAEMAMDDGVRVLNLAGTFPAGMWADAVHMNADGRAAMSAALGRFIAGGNG